MEEAALARRQFAVDVAKVIEDGGEVEIDLLQAQSPGFDLARSSTSPSTACKALPAVTMASGNAPAPS